MSVLPEFPTQKIDFLGFPIGNIEEQDGTMSRTSTPIIAELGINHNGSVEMAHTMLEIAAECGVDIVKLQKRDLKTTYQARYVERPDTAPGGLANYISVLKRCELTERDYIELKLHAERLEIGFLVTPFDLPSVEFLERLGVKAYKVGSCDATNPILLKAIAETKKSMLVSTGMTDEVTIFQVVEYLDSIAQGRFALMHAVSGYPAAFRDCQLHMIRRLKINHKVPVGWSGHERGVAVSVGAVAVGADILERHFTLDRTMSGPDHAASLEPDGLKKLVERVRAFEEAYGNAYLMAKGLTRGEEASKEVLGKSLVAKRDIQIGTEFGWADIEARSPGRGLTPMALLTNGDTWMATRSIRAGEELAAEDLKAPLGMTVC